MSPVADDKIPLKTKFNKMYLILTQKNTFILHHTVRLFHAVSFSPAIILSMTAVFFTIEECDHLQAVVSPQTRGLPDELVIGRLRTEPTQSGSSPFLPPFLTLAGTDQALCCLLFIPQGQDPAAVLYRILPTFILRCCNCNGCAVTVIDLWFNQPVCKPGSVREFQPSDHFVNDCGLFHYRRV